MGVSRDDFEIVGSLSMKNTCGVAVLTVDFCPIMRERGGKSIMKLTYPSKVKQKELYNGISFIFNHSFSHEGLHKVYLFNFITYIIFSCLQLPALYWALTYFT